jgi:signal transduction histidine kinase
MTDLYFQNPVTHEFREIAHWEPGGGHSEELSGLKACRACLARGIGESYAFRECEGGALGSLAPGNFCLPVASGTELVALMKFRTVPGGRLSREQTELFKNIGDEISVALKAGHDRKVMREISDAELTLNERRKVSYFLHDNLAQNIGYLRLKLDQILTEADALSPELFINDLANMQSVANDSYDTIRGILETLTPQSQPGFASILKELAEKMGQRARLEIDFKTTGRVHELPVETAQALLYAYQEILSNVEKHSHAERTEILVQWNPEELAIQISDNGIGFNPERVDAHKHFGLGILHERITAVHGRIEIKSREMAGTTVSLFAPVFQAQNAR